MFPRKPHAAAALAGALALALGLGACSSGSSTSPTDTGPDFGTNDPAVVVGLGDSITFGIFDAGVGSCDEWLRDAGGYCPDLARLVGKTVINEGVCGENSSGGASRIESVLQRRRPGVILIDYSPNDLFTGTDELVDNLRFMIAAARANNTVPILGTLLPAVGEHQGWEPFIEDVNVKIRTICAQEGIECADHFQAFISDPDYIKSPYSLLSHDGLHPNSAGYELMAKTWRWPLLRVY